MIYCKAICKDIQSSNNLNRVNFSSCNLTHEGAEILANLIKVQALKRHNEAWKDSLRYGRPDLDSMFGIRRITINSNPLIGDRGVFLLAEAFKSDLWLKALDLQDCGITTTGANYLLDGLKFNAMMHVLDVRLNVKIDRDTLQKIMEQVMINSSGHSTDYEWMDLTQAAAISMNIATKPKGSIYYLYFNCYFNLNNFYLNLEIKSSQVVGSGSHSTDQTSLTNSHQQQQHSQNSILIRKLKKRRNTNASFSKKAQFISANNSLKMKRCKSTGSVILNKSSSSNNNNLSPNQQPKHHQIQHHKNYYIQQHKQDSQGIPWRTAARANRYRVSTNCAYRKVVASSSFKSNDENYQNDEEYDDDLDEEDAGNEESFVDDALATHDDDHLADNYNQNNNKENMINGAAELYETNENVIHRIKPSSNSLNGVNSKEMNRLSMMASSTFDNEKFSINNNKHQQSQRKQNEPLTKNEIAINLDKTKNMSVKDLLVILQREQESKTQLEDMLIRVTILLFIKVLIIIIYNLFPFFY